MSQQALFVEAGTPFTFFPNWVRYCLETGFRWPTETTRRRLTVLSMPCDSPAAGLVAVGLVSRDLCVARAESRQQHFDYLLAFAKQYLSSCRACELCDPEVRGCGYVSRALGILRNPAQPDVKFFISDKSDPDEERLVWQYSVKKSQPVTQWASKENIVQWHVDGQPPAFSSPHVVGLDVRPFKALYPQANFFAENLSVTTSGVCLAVPSEGEEFFSKRFRTTGFMIDDQFFNIASLLSFMSPRSRGVSKSVLFNCRSGRLDRPISSACTVVADGAASFLRALAEPELKYSNIVGIIDRTASPDSLEALGERLRGLRQWYDLDQVFEPVISSKPSGVDVLSILKR